MKDRGKSKRTQDRKEMFKERLGERVFEFERVGETRGDAMAPYIVKLDKVYTVKEFIETVLTKRNDDWGYIGIYCKNETFGKPRCEYEYGKLIYSLPDDILNKKIIKATADGGWSRLDYLLWLEHDIKNKKVKKPLLKNKEIKDRLKPCPFCGAVAKMQIDKDLHSYVIKCTKCPVDFGRYWQFKKSEVIKEWNKRVHTT